MKCISWVCATLMAFVWTATSRAEIKLLSTAERPFESGAFNQGYFREAGNTNSLSGNYFTGTFHSISPERETPSRSFFSFYFGDVDRPASAATLILDRGWERGSEIENELTETVEFFDVTTSAVFLNTSDAFTAAVFADLGTGNSYGIFDVPRNTNGPPGTILRVPLNGSALADINMRPNSEYFTIGCSLITNDGFDGVFGFTGATPVILELTLVPEPSAFVLSLTCAVVGCNLGAFRSVRNKSFC